MSVLWSERELYRPQAVVSRRPPRPKGGQFSLLARGPVFPTLRRWIPEWRERVDYFLRRVFRGAFAFVVMTTLGFLVGLLFGLWLSQ